MKIKEITETTFGELKAGDIFGKRNDSTLSELLKDEMVYDEIKECHVDTRGYLKIDNPLITMNAVLINKGELRTFTPEFKVFKYELV